MATIYYKFLDKSYILITMINSSVNDIKTLDKNQLKPKLHILIREFFTTVHITANKAPQPQPVHQSLKQLHYNLQACEATITEFTHASVTTKFCDACQVLLVLTIT